MSDTPAEAPAVDPLGDKVYICPACGTRYDEPTDCANGHPPTQTVEYDRATVEAADAGDAEAQAAVAQTEADAAGTGAGAVASEASPAAPVEPTPVEPTPVEPAPVEPAPAVEPAPVVEPAPTSSASSCDVTVTIDGVTYSGTISTS